MASCRQAGGFELNVQGWCCGLGFLDILDSGLRFTVLVGIGQREVMTLQLPLIEAGLGLSHECLAARPPVLIASHLAAWQSLLQNLPSQPRAQNHNKKLDNPRSLQSQAPNETSRAKGHRHRPGIPAPRLAAEAGRPRIWGFLSWVQSF